MMYKTEQKKNELFQWLVEGMKCAHSLASETDNLHAQIKLAGMFEWILQSLCRPTHVSEEEGRVLLKEAVREFEKQNQSLANVLSRALHILEKTTH